jgi:hypothetical protein
MNNESIILLYDNSARCEIFNRNNEEIKDIVRYWMRKRWSQEVTSGYILGEELPIKKWKMEEVKRILDENINQIEYEEKKEYERLKKKFEK